MRYGLMMMAGMLVASPAYAVKVVNLDAVTHTVLFDAAGHVSRQEVQPNGSARFVGAEGLVSLVTPNPKMGGAINTDGILAGATGARDQNVPVDVDDELTIWPGGRLMLQKRGKRTKY